MNRRSSVLHPAVWMGFFILTVAGLLLASGHVSPLLMAQENTHAKIESGKIDTKVSETTAKPADKKPKTPGTAAKAAGAQPEAAKKQDPEKQAKEQAAGPKVESVKKAEPATEEKEQAEEEESEEQTNESCLECHNPEILKWSKEEKTDNVDVGEKPAPPSVKPRFVFGELSLSIDKKKFEAGVHADTACVECHQGIKEIPHKQRLGRVNCAECHDEAAESIAAGIHGKKAGKKAPPCIGCHDVHYGKDMDAYAAQWKMKACVRCHKKYGLDTVAAHKNLYEANMHLTSLGCMICHKGKEPGVHNMTSVKAVQCDSCHSKVTVLAEKKEAPKPFWAYVTQARFINDAVRKKFGYVIGANRIPLLDLIIILAVLGPMALPVFHGGLRILTRRKGPIELPEEKILLHPFIERLWHWVQALCIVMLIITGVVLHWPEKFPGWFDWAVGWHNVFGITALIAFLVWLIYNLGTGRIKHYIPTREEIPAGLVKQAKFYGVGIFKHEPHPYAPSEDNKFNPLQKIAYLQFQVLLFPILLLSGILYMYPETFKGIIDAIGGMTVLAIVHYILGGLFAAFLVAHLYLATTGETVGENFKAIVFGYGIKSDHTDTKNV
jgi:thiosulfate reductase cytochrome b subunit